MKIWSDYITFWLLEDKISKKGRLTSKTLGLYLYPTVHILIKLQIP